MSEKKKKKSNIIIKIIISVFMVIIAYMILWSIPFPHTKTEFESYKEFRKSFPSFYPESLPVSMNVIKYYDYDGWRDGISGVMFSLNKNDYEEFKKDYTTGDSYYIDENGNGYIEYEKYSDEIFFERVNNFLNQMIGDDLENYIILKKSIHDDEWFTSTTGVMANDDINTIIFFFVYDKYPCKR